MKPIRKTSDLTKEYFS